MTERKVTPSQTVGPYFKYGLVGEDYGFPGIVGNDLTQGMKKTPDNAIRIEGRVLDGEGQPVNDALIEIWQANGEGRYAHPEDDQDKTLTEGFAGFGRCGTDETGAFSFITIKPGRVPGRGNTLQAPHISVNVLARGVLKRLATRIYFEDEAAANGEDPVLGQVEAERRGTLIATKENGNIYRFDVHIHGDGETVFFDV